MSDEIQYIFVKRGLNRLNSVHELQHLLSAACLCDIARDDIAQLLSRAFGDLFGARITALATWQSHRGKTDEKARQRRDDAVPDGHGARDHELAFFVSFSARAQTTMARGE